MQRNNTSFKSYYNRVGGSMSNWRVAYKLTKLLGMKDTRRLSRALCIFWPSTPSQPFQEIVNNKETHLPIESVMEVILKHMTSPTVKIKSSTIVTTNSIHLLIVQTRRRKSKTTTKITSPVKKVKLVLKTCPKIWRRLRRPSPPYKLRYQILKRTNTTYRLRWRVTGRFIISVEELLPGNGT